VLDNPLRQQAFLALTVEDWQAMKPMVDHPEFQMVTVSAIHKTHQQHGCNMFGLSEINLELVSTVELIEKN
jgi:hypothetical protein